MNPALFSIAFSMARVLAEDVGAPELRNEAAFAPRPYRRSARPSIRALCARLGIAAASANDNHLHTCAGGTSK